MKISEVKFICEECGKEKVFENVEIVEKSYNQYVIDVLDQDEDNFDGHCECEYDED